MVPACLRPPPRGGLRRADHGRAARGRWVARRLLIRALVDFPDAAGARRPLAFGAPRRVIVAHHPRDLRPVLDAVEAEARRGAYAAGYVSYEAAPAFDRALAVRGGARLPLAWFGVFDAPLPAPPPPPSASAAPPAAWTPDLARDTYDTAVRAIREAIARGDVYQVSYTLRLRARWNASREAFLSWHAALCEAQGGGYFAYLDTGDATILSASPELFFRRTADSIVTRPMKGTARRGRWAEEDDAAAAALAANETERAENVMILDQLRHDLGRVARPGTVRVPRLFDVERYRTVLQLTSTVEAELRPDASLADVFAALFPCVSVTGAPKPAAMSVIARLESTPREVYCGAVGLVTPGGDCAFNVGIRTVWVDMIAGAAEYGVGGGVTWDSTPEGKYDEVLAQAAILGERWPAFELLETMRLEGGTYVRLDRHLARLTSSARYFGIGLDGAVVLAALGAHAAEHAGSGARRARLLVSTDGVPRVESRPLDQSGGAGPAPRAVALASDPVPRGDRFLYHKTTHRELYDVHRRAHPEAFDVLLWNDADELTEFTVGNVVVELNGSRLTPPRECGLLAGTFRAELLETGEVRERVVRVEELARATSLWLVNSVRGWVPVRLGTPAAGR